MRCISCVVGLAVAVSLTLSSPLSAATFNSVFDPLDYTPLGSLTVNTGTITINTDTLAFDAPGASFSSSGVTAVSQSGNVEMAVFTFNSLNIGSGVTSINIVGSRGVSILSRSNLDFGANIVGIAGLNGANGSGTTGGAGGAGAESGAAGGPTVSNPPGATGGNGGSGGSTPVAAVGFGAGFTQQSATIGGGGGGYGGTGGGQTVSAIYGDALLTDLFGGSGGAYGWHSGTSGNRLGGGAGAGSLELVALGNLSLTGNLELRGGNGVASTSNAGSGGGGSGGGLILAAPSIDFSGMIDVRGGNGGPNTQSGTANRSGGGGGGGRVAFYTDSLIGTSDTISDILLDGGLAGITGGGQNSLPGGDGSFAQTSFPTENFGFPPVPEPSTLTLAALGWLALLKRRRRRA